MDGTLATSLAAGLAVFALFLAIPAILRFVNPENAILFRTLNFLTWVVRLRYGLQFRHVKPPFRLLVIFHWGTFLPKWRSHPVGLDGLLECHCPPYYKTMAD